MTKKDAEDWMAGVLGEMTGRKGAHEGRTPGSGPSPEDGNGSPGGDESPALRVARAVKAQRDREAEELDLARVVVEESGAFDQRTIDGMPPDELRVAAGFDHPETIVGPDAHAGDPAVNADRAAKPPGGDSLMSAEERARRREANETTVDPGVVAYRKAREGT